MSEQALNFRIGDLLLYKNNQLIAFNKPSTIPVQPDKSGTKALINLGEIYCKSTLHLIHRIDRPASGVVLFAKNKKAAASLSEQFKKAQIKKTYLAVVQNPPPKKEDLLEHFLTKNSVKNRSYVCPEARERSKLAQLKYKLIGSSDRYHLLEIELLSGRHHQIRTQLAAIGCPIRGDVKYGFKRGNKDRSIQLHAWKLSFQHPISKENEYLEAPLPEIPIWQAFF